MAKLFNMRIQMDYFRFLLGRNRRFIALMSAAMLLVYPVFVMTMISLNSYGAPDALFIVGRVFAMLLFVLFAILVPLLMFAYLNNKKDLDVYFALPIKREEMFQTTGWAGYVILLIPFTLAWLTGGVIAFIYSTISLVLLSETFFTIIMIGSAIYMVTIFTMMNTGTSLDAFLYNIAVHLLPVLIYGAYLLFGFSMLLGFSDLNSYRILNFISPIWALFSAVFATNLMFPPLAYGLYWVLITLVLSAFSGYLYSTRRSEKAETPFVNKRFFPIVSTAYAVLTLILLYNVIYNTNSNPSLFTLENLVFPLMFAGVLFIVMDTIANRGAKNMVKALLRYALVALITLIVFIPGSLTGGFGYVTRVPKAANVKSVELNMTGSAGLVFPSNYFSYSYNGSDGYTSKISSLLNQLQSQDMLFDSQEDIKSIVAFHHIILNEYKWVDYSTKSHPTRPYERNDITLIPNYTPSYKAFPFEKASYDSSNVTITYRMNDGSKLRRTYEISWEWTRDLLTLSSSKQMVKMSAPLIANIGLFDSFSGFKLYDALMTNTTADMNKFDFKVFAAKYMEDIDAIAATRSYLPDAAIRGYLEVSGSVKTTSNSTFSANDRIAIDSRFTKTLAWLSAQGYAFPKPVYTADSAVLILPKSATRNVIHYVAGINPSIYSYSDAEKDITFVRLTPQQLTAIMPYMSASGFSETPLPALFTSNNLSAGDKPQDPVPANGMKNLLVEKERLTEVMAIIKNNPRQTSTGYNFFTTTK